MLVATARHGCRNVVTGMIAAVGVYLQNDPKIAQLGLMYGWGQGAWLTTIWQGAPIVAPDP